MTVPAAEFVAKHRAATHKPKHAVPTASPSGESPRAHRPHAGAPPGKGATPDALDTGNGSPPAVPVTGSAGTAGRGLSISVPSLNGSRRLLAAELFIGSAIILASPAARDQGSPFTDALKQEAYLLMTFLILALLAMGGAQTARAASAMGGLIVLVLALRATQKGVIGKKTLSADTAEPLATNPSTDITTSPEQI